MEKSLNSILFKNLSRFAFPESPASEHHINLNSVAMVLSANRNLASYGYSLSLDALKSLMAFSPIQVTSIYSDLISVIKEYKGSEYFNSIELFYPNFPEEVMKKSDAEIYFNSLLYYTFSQTGNEVDRIIADAIRNAITEKPKKRLPLIKNFPRELKIINSASAKDLDNLIINKIHAPKGLNQDELNDIKTYFGYCPDKINMVTSADTPYQSKENLAKTALLLYDMGAEKKVAGLFKDSKDVLRFAALLSNRNFGRDINNAELAVKKTTYNNNNGKIQFKLTKQEQRLIKNMLNNCPNLYYDIWKDEGLYKRLMNRINAKKGPERVVKAFDNLANSKKTDEHGRIIVPVPRQFDFAIANLMTLYSDDNNPIEFNPNPAYLQLFDKLVDNFPGYFVQHYIDYIDSAAKYGENTFEIIASRIDKCNVPVQTLLTLYNAFDLRKIENDTRIFRNKSGKLLTSENKLFNLSRKQIAAAKELIQMRMKKSIYGTKQLGKVYVDPKLENVKIPLRDMRNCSAGNIIPPYSKIDGLENKNLLAFGIYWKNYTDENGISHRGDIDLAVRFYNEYKEIVGHVYYSNLRAFDYAVHSGDYTDAPNGATEMVLMDKEAMKDMGIKYAVVEVHGFSVPFNQAENLRFIMLEKEGHLKCDKDYNLSDYLHADSKSYSNKSGKVVFLGKPFDPLQIEHPIKINAASTYATPCIYDVDEDKTYWIDYAGSINLMQNTVSNDKINQASLQLDYAKNNAIPNMKQLFYLYADACGSITQDIKEADTVFSLYPLDTVKEQLKDTVHMISSYDLDYISNEFCGKAEKPVSEAEIGMELKTRKDISNKAALSDKPMSVKTEESRHHNRKYTEDELEL